MKKVMIAVVLSLVAANAMAAKGMPLFNVKCNKVSVHGDQDGAVYFDGKEVKVKKVNDNYFEATGKNMTVSITKDSGEFSSASWTGKKRANGMCTEE